MKAKAIQMQRLPDLYRSKDGTEGELLLVHNYSDAGRFQF
jgi:hypothetical protein